ncbi:MAG: heavy metal translocating P-type ATPase [Clostridia bacterium]|nr:heavy metal translocating P-type ATPase [Clostridia bacterium]
MQKFNVTGMSCAACSARVEKAVSNVDGVKTCSVNLLTNSMTVEGDVSESEIIKAVENAGYGASTDNGKAPEKKEETDNVETKKILLRLTFSIIFLAALMYISMGRMVGLPLPSALENNHLANALTQMLLSLAVMVINQKFFISGFKGIIKGAPNMDTLVSLGSAAAFGYSTAMVYKMTVSHSHSLLHGLYFESAAMILTLITVGKLLEARAKGKTTSALKGLMSLSPETATVIKDGKEITVPIASLNVGDIFTVRPGQIFPADGKVIEGISSVNEASLTGESVPADKTVGSPVSSGTVNLSGFLKCEATKVGHDTVLQQIIKTVSDASASKAPIARIADKVSGIFVPTVLLIALLTGAAWLIAEESIGFALARGISVLVISCPCALGLATPVAIMVGSGVGAKNGILFKSASALEEIGKTKVVILDKTGTVTHGTPTVSDVIPIGCDRNELLTLAYSVETGSEHPLSKAVTSFALESGVSPLPVENFSALTGSGVSALVNGEAVYGGKLSMISELAPVSDEAEKLAEKLSNEGKTPLFFAKKDVLLGIIAVSDEVKDDSADAIKALHEMKIKTVMLTGDNEMTARAIADKVGIDEVVAGVLPNEKAERVKLLRKYGKTAMVGDGINDTPALTEADVGIAIGAGSDIAIDSADAVLMKSSLSDVPAAIKLGKNTLRNIKENLFWAFFYNVLGIPLAAGAFIPLTGWEMNPMIGALAMSLSSFFVVSNALRLNLIPIRKKSKSAVVSEPIPEPKKDENTKTYAVYGMMCHHCENAVKTALEKIDGISEAVADHTQNKVTVKFTSPVDDETIVNAIINEGYEVK